MSGKCRPCRRNKTLDEVMRTPCVSKSAKRCVDAAFVKLARLESAAAGHRERCEWCDYFEANRLWLGPCRNGVCEELSYQHCPMCGRKLTEV